MIPLLTDIDREHDLLRALDGYLAAVGAALGVGEESCTADVDTPVSAYIALDGRLARNPDRDTALLWDERHGWSFAMETHSGEDLLVLAYLGGDLVPTPGRVADFVAAICSFEGPIPAPVPPVSRSDPDGVLSRLACYRRDRPADALLLPQAV
ncbi:DUF6292 family protein [Amycolatopsis decaplanina]|uniref:DUF6292 domain-containing protein n=1 Tax=Amycolatopsis decaplanina DSM 44594 TaxID=1284240 RepID=M2XBT6_9PSEU|nr:DUF6292 family protein [Amycolatopsis decaplanina]EME58581.1 hypothetical protein H074_18418 [Amycolatopsis decaplanina DSM 44594]